MTNEIAQTIVEQDVAEEIQRSYLDYAMSVIVQRALPDVRDGMKPVARRILYSMWRQGLRSNARLRKSANVVGDVLGKYHPHGDLAVYDALARLTQDFSLRYPLIIGQGNWGSMDGDRQAAMRYTETKLASIADEMMLDIEKETVNWVDNYDGTRKEPTVLPSRLPQFLLNGTLGIAVGMATNVPPHNMREVCDALMLLIDKPEATVEDLMEFVKGPDFPTGAAIYNRKEILAAYATGKGSIVTRAKASIEEAKSGFRIIVHEVPYLVNKATLIEKIAAAVKDKKLEGIRDLRDESNQEGVRIVIELKKDAFPKKVLNRLYVLTDLQKTFHVNMLALTDGGRQPKIFTLKEVLQEHIEHRREVVTRRTQYELDRAKEREHILEGLSTALDHIDEVIAVIKASKNKEIAAVNLEKKFALSERQSTAILEMRLQTLSGLERKKIDDELTEKRALIKELTSLLKSPKKLLGVIREDYKNLKDRYGDERRTKVFVKAADEFQQEDLIPNDPAVITVTSGGYVKRLPTDSYSVQGRGGKGVRGKMAKPEDVVDIFLATKTHAQLLFFTSLGRVFSIPAYEIPETSRTAKGQALQNFLELAGDESVTAINAMPLNDKDESGYLVMATVNGLVKKTALKEFQNIRRSGLKALTLKGDDKLNWVSASSGEDEILLVSRMGQAIQFAEKDVRAMGRTAAGVKGMKLRKDDLLVAMHVIAPGEASKKEVLVMSEHGFGKRTKLSEYRAQGRGGSGLKSANVTGKTGPLVNATVLEAEAVKTTDILVTSEKGQVIRIPASSVSQQGRATQGVRVMKPTSDSGSIATFTTWSS